MLIVTGWRPKPRKVESTAHQRVPSSHNVLNRLLWQRAFERKNTFFFSFFSPFQFCCISFVATRINLYNPVVYPLLYIAAFLVKARVLYYYVYILPRSLIGDSFNFKGQHALFATDCAKWPIYNRGDKTLKNSRDHKTIILVGRG